MHQFNIFFVKIALQTPTNMKILVIILGIFCFSKADLFAQRSFSQDPCQIFGKVYQESHYEKATYYVYIEEDEFLADLVVYKDDNELQADKTGRWFFTETKSFADFSIYLTDERSKADFTIFFTENQQRAKCNQ